MSKTQHLVLIDGSGYIFRAYYALPPMHRKRDNLPVNALAGFCHMLWKLLCDLDKDQFDISPTHLAVVFDYSSNTFRKEIYPQYKATRRAPPEDLIPQFPLIRAATRAFQIPVIEKEGYEADDLLASYTNVAKQQAMQVTIFSSDKDLMQLVDDKVSLYDAVKNYKITPQQVYEKWGIAPEKMQDFQVLTGDSSDNIPGVAGIGPKTAAKLLEEFGSLDSILDNLDKIPQAKRRQALEEAKPNIDMVRQLVCLRKDIDLPLPLASLSLKRLDYKRTISFLKAMEFQALTQKIAKKFAIESAEIPPDPEYALDSPQATFSDKSLNDIALQQGTPLDQRIEQLKQHYRELYAQEQNSCLLVKEQTSLKSLIERIRAQGYFSYNFDFYECDKILTLKAMTIALNEKEAFYLPLQNFQDMPSFAFVNQQEQAINLEDFIEKILPLFENEAIRKIGYNIKQDWRALKRIFKQKITSAFMNSYDDLLLMSYVLHNGKLDHKLELLGKSYFCYDNTERLKSFDLSPKKTTKKAFSLDYQMAYQSDCASLMLSLDKVLRLSMIKQGLNGLYEYFDKALLPILSSMEEIGVLLDLSRLKILSSELKNLAGQLEENIYTLAGERFNIGSPKQLGEILFQKLNLQSRKKTKTKQMSTAGEVLEELALEGYEIAQKILDWRQLTKIITTYSDALPKYADSAGRVHTSYSPAATMTGRLASSAPNLQNIPIRTQEGGQIRSAIIAPSGYRLLSLDYSQIELRLLAHIANISPLQNAFSEGRDIHTLTAARVLNLPIEEVTTELRRHAKTINYGIIYGMSAFGLAKQLKMSKAEAKLYIDAYLKTMPGIEDYMEETKAMAREKGYVTTLFGRKVYYPDINSPKPMLRALSERAAMNAPLQGTASDIMRRAMIKIDNYLKEAHLEAEIKMLMQVHDELVFEVKEDKLAQIAPILQKIMENAAAPLLSIKPKLEVDIKIGQNWQEELHN